MKITVSLLVLVTFHLCSLFTYAATFNVDGLGAELGGWVKKNNTAAEYKSAGSNYRTYKPTFAPTPEGGVLVSTKVDHIRGGGGDDHCQLEMTFDKDGKIVDSSSKITMGNHFIDTGIITSSAALAGASEGTSAALAVGAKIAKQLADQISSLNEHGGRANFPSVVKYNLNLIAKYVTP